MELAVRPARQEDACVPLLYESAKPYYDAYAGGQRRALALLCAVFPRDGHAASYELCRVAVAGEQLVGVLAVCPGADGARLARRFGALALPRLPPWRWPGTLRHLKPAGVLSPHPPPN